MEVEGQAGIRQNGKVFFPKSDEKNASKYEKVSGYFAVSKNGKIYPTSSGRSTHFGYINLNAKAAATAAEEAAKAARAQRSASLANRRAAIVAAAAGVGSMGVKEGAASAAATANPLNMSEESEYRRKFRWNPYNKSDGWRRTLQKTINDIRVGNSIPYGRHNALLNFILGALEGKKSKNVVNSKYIISLLKEGVSAGLTDNQILEAVERTLQGLEGGKRATLRRRRTHRRRTHRSRK